MLHTFDVDYPLEARVGGTAQVDLIKVYSPVFQADLVHKLFGGRCGDGKSSVIEAHPMIPMPNLNGFSDQKVVCGRVGT